MTQQALSRQSGTLAVIPSAPLPELSLIERLTSERSRAASDNGTPESSWLPPTFVAVDADTPGGPYPPERWGFYNFATQKQLSNFTIRLHQVVRSADGVVHFQGDVHVLGRRYPLRLTEKEFGNDSRLRENVGKASGWKADHYVAIGKLRSAVVELCPVDELPVRTVVVDFGWNEALDAYLVPGGAITAGGFLPDNGGTPWTLELPADGLASSLGMTPLASEILLLAKRHIIEDLLNFHDRRVTYSLLAMCAASALYRFVKGLAGRPALWLLGTSGAGKSLPAQLFAHFFGNFGFEEHRSVTWGSTANAIEAEGHLFKDALLVIDDFKHAIAPRDTVRILQNYADGNARQRMQGGQASRSLPIRGLVVSTAEDVPEREGSTLARLLVVRVPQHRDHERADRCRQLCRHYSGVMLDFIRHLLASGRCREFEQRVAARRQDYLRGIAGVPNDARIASNFALLAAAFEEIAEYFADVWPAQQEETRRFLQEDLRAIRDEAVKTLRQQEPARLYLETLTELIAEGQVRIIGHRQEGEVIGKVAEDGNWLLSTTLSLKAVQQDRKERGLEPLRLNARTLLKELDQGGLVIRNGENLTQYLRLGGKPSHCFLIKPEGLLRE